MENSELQKIKELLYNSEYGVFFGGAGVSTESGIPDFRSADGLYKEASNEYYLSRSCLENEPEKFYRFYKEKMLYPDAKPNFTHNALCELEKAGVIKAVITQNIDGLHQAAGSKEVIELHGTTLRNYCRSCKRLYDGDFIAKSEDLPLCPVCGGLVRPDVTLYEENLDYSAMNKAKMHVDAADFLLVGGTSLNVYPAAGFVAGYKGKNLIIVNLSPTPFDNDARYVIRMPLSEFFRYMI